MTGLFITFEGVEGSGKSTQIGLLDQWLRQGGHEPVLTREPGGTSLGKRIRELVLHGADAIAPRAELLLYAADRAQHMAEIVEPALHAGRNVLCDRHADSLIAYQAFGRGLDRTLVEELNQVATGGRKPDLTFILDLDPALGLGRATSRGTPDRLEREALAFHQRVREGYLAIAREEPRRVHVLDGSGSPEMVQQGIRAVIASVKS